MANDYHDGEVTFEILEHIGVIATFPTGWRKEINFVSWNGAAGKYDIRDWDPYHERMSRGITLKEKEMRVMMELVRRRSHKSQDEPEREPRNRSKWNDSAESRLGSRDGSNPSSNASGNAGSMAGSSREAYEEVDDEIPFDSADEIIVDLSEEQAADAEQAAEDEHATNVEQAAV